MADHHGEYWYLDEGVDANKITVPELGSILLKHGVTYPSSAKKAALVAPFTGSFGGLALPWFGTAPDLHLSTLKARDRAPHRVQADALRDHRNVQEAGDRPQKPQHARVVE
ncbi:hypothetical protein NX059_012460 [Plenodomus lindquistii]|nr:hypothetical protein NX059_012460 [Plenodomus lindquistii]